MKRKFTSRCNTCGHEVHHDTSPCPELTKQSSALRRRYLRLIGLRIVTVSLLLVGAARVLLCPVPLSSRAVSFFVWAITTVGVLLGAAERQNWRVEDESKKALPDSKNRRRRNEKRAVKGAGSQKRLSMESQLTGVVKRPRTK